MSDEILENEYPGVGRLHYFLGNVGLIATTVLVVTVFGPDSRVMKVSGLLLMIASVVLDVMRLRNMGVSQWLVFGRFLPFGKTLLWIAMTTAQTGWNETRRLDSAGKSILITELVLFGLMLFLMLREGMRVWVWF
jgi:hypothetical protein